MRRVNVNYRMAWSIGGALSCRRFSLISKECIFWVYRIIKAKVFTIRTRFKWGLKTQYPVHYFKYSRWKYWFLMVFLICFTIALKNKGSVVNRVINCMHRSAKSQTPPNAVDLLWSCEGLWRGLSFVFSMSDCHLTI